MSSINTLDDINALPVTITYAGACVPDNWGDQLADHWTAKIGGHNFDYFTGLGLRKSAFGRKNPYPSRTVAHIEWNAQHVHPVAPSPVDVLSALARDATAHELTFSEWCDDYGYDCDSIKAQDTYRACLRNTDKLLETFSRFDIARIAELTADL